jgi:outer membrane protein assembly factor BamB
MSSPSCSRLTVPLALLLLAACGAPVSSLFTVSTGGASRAELVAVEDGVLVGNEAGRLLRLDTRGETLWRVELGREVAVAPTVSANTVVVGTQGGALLAVSLSDGQERWRLTGQAAPLAPLVSDAESVFLMEAGGKVRALSVEAGTTRWVQAVGRPPSPARPEGPLPTPVLVDGLLVVGVPGQAGLVALSTRDGTVRWRSALLQILGMEARDDALYVSTRGGDVLSLGLADGHVRWKRTLSPALTSPPSLALGHLWVGTEEPALVALSSADGTEVSRRPLPGPLVTHVVGFQSWILVPTRSGAGWLLGYELPVTGPRFSLKLDTAILSRPVMRGQQMFVLGRDGRVQSWKLQPPAS